MNTRQKNIAVKIVAGGAAVITGVALGGSAVTSALKFVDLGFLFTGKEPVKCFMKNPEAKIFKGYRIYDPVTDTTRKVSKKEFLKVMAEIPETKKYVQAAAAATAGILTLGGITYVLYKNYTEKKKLGDTEFGRDIQEQAYENLNGGKKKKNKKNVTNIDDFEDEIEDENDSDDNE